MGYESPLELIDVQMGDGPSFTWWSTEGYRPTENDRTGKRWYHVISEADAKKKELVIQHMLASVA